MNELQDTRRASSADTRYKIRPTEAQAEAPDLVSCIFVSLYLCILLQLHPEQLGEGGDIQIGADHAEAADHGGTALADVGLTGDVVEVDPASTVGCGDNALGAQDHAVLALVAEGVQLVGHGGAVKGGGGLGAAAHEDLVGVVVMVVVIVTAAALAVVVVVMLMVVIVAMAFLTVLVVVMMLMVVVVAVALLTVLMVMVALALLVVMMMVVMLGLLCQAGQLGLQGVGALHGLQELGTGEVVPYSKRRCSLPEW